MNKIIPFTVVPYFAANDIATAMNSNMKIQAIRWYHEASGFGLKESKDVIEWMFTTPPYQRRDYLNGDAYCVPTLVSTVYSAAAQIVENEPSERDLVMNRLTDAANELRRLGGRVTVTVSFDL
jgi:hypothetical protein